MHACMSGQHTNKLPSAPSASQHLVPTHLHTKSPGPTPTRASSNRTSLLLSIPSTRMGAEGGDAAAVSKGEAEPPPTAPAVHAAAAA